MNPLLSLVLFVCTGSLIGFLLVITYTVVHYSMKAPPRIAPPGAPEENFDALIEAIAATTHHAQLASLIARSMKLPAPAQEQCLQALRIRMMEFSQNTNH